MRKHVRRIGGAIAVAAVAMVVPAFTAAPASAVSQTVIHPEIIDGCEGCPGPLFKVQDILTKQQIPAVTRSVASGVSGLITAARTKDPVAAKRIHDAAIKTLSTGAAQAGNASWAPGDPDGDLCPRRKWPFPGPKPGWDQLESQLSQGMTLLAQANRTGDGGLVTKASGLLDGGAAGLTTFQGCV